MGFLIGYILLLQLLSTVSLDRQAYFELVVLVLKLKKCLPKMKGEKKDMSICFEIILQ